MPITNKKKYVSDMIPKKSLNDMINKYRIVEIIAGVGAGKNSWAEKLVERSYAGKKNILYITSRAAVKESIKRAVGGKNYIDMDDIVDVWEGKTYKHVIFTVTNSGLRRFMEKNDLTQEICQIWRYLDYIVIDEYHSLATDSSFSDDPFYVERFLRMAHRGNERLCIIAMTGTPKPVDWLFTKGIRKNPWFHSYDWLDVCQNTVPDEVEFIGYEEAKDLLMKYLEKGDKAVYFTKSVGKMRFFIEELVDKKSILMLDEIAIGFSDEYDGTGKKKGKSSSAASSGVDDEDASSKEKLISFVGEAFIKTNRDEIRQKLVEAEMLPPNIKLFITTSQNKEGVSIKNDDINIMFVESTTRDEIMQMSGRIRNGLCKLYCVMGQDFTKEMDTVYYEYRDDRLIGRCNDLLEEFEKEIADKPNDDTYEELRKKLIEDIPKTFEYIMYDKYIEKRFIWYTGKFHNARQQHMDRKWLKHCVDKVTYVDGLYEENGFWSNWDVSFPYDEDENGETLFITGQEFLEKYWFPGTKKVSYTPGKSKAEHDKIKLKEAADKVRKYIINNGLLWVHIEKANVADLLTEVNAIYGKETKKSYTKLGQAIKNSELMAIPRTTKGDEGIIIVDMSIDEAERNTKLKEAKDARKAELKKKAKLAATAVPAKTTKTAKPAKAKKRKK